MEIEPGLKMLSKKLKNTVRIILYMLKKSILKTKIILNLNMLFKSGKIAGKAMGQIMHHLHQDYSTVCNSTDVHMSIVPLREYEFSCSNSPAYPSYLSKRKNNYQPQRSYSYPAQDMNLARKVFDFLNKNDEFDQASSPLVALPGFGHSPMVRQLRVSDSPFSVKECEENPQVDMDCEEFIKMIRKDFERQETMASIESPPLYCVLAR